MTPTNASQPPAAMASALALQFYYFGFFKALKRYRRTSLAGWGIALAGCITIILHYTTGAGVKARDVVLAALTIGSGIGIVWQSIAALEEYVRVQFPPSHDQAPSDAILRMQEIMKDVDDGGWRDAYDAIGALRRMQMEFNLPPLE